MNPKGDPQEAAETLMHEVEHARNDAAREAAFTSGSRQTYLDHMFEEETKAVMQEVEHNEQLRAAGTQVEVNGTESIYRSSYDQGRTDHLAQQDAYRDAYNAARDAELANCTPPYSDLDQGYADLLGREAGNAKLQELHPPDSDFWGQADAAGRSAGRSKVLEGFKDGTIKPSGEHGFDSYGDLYGDGYDRAHGTGT
jgi:hypothetical protein